MYISVVVEWITLASMDWHIPLESLLSYLHGGACRTRISSILTKIWPIQFNSFTLTLSLVAPVAHLLRTSFYWRLQMFSMRIFFSVNKQWPRPGFAHAHFYRFRFTQNGPNCDGFTKKWQKSPLFTYVCVTMIPHRVGALRAVPLCGVTNGNSGDMIKIYVCNIAHSLNRKHLPVTLLTGCIDIAER